MWCLVLKNPKNDKSEVKESTKMVVVAWRNGNAFHSINGVTLRRARLVLGWATACGQVNHLGMQPAA